MKPGTPKFHRLYREHCTFDGRTYLKNLGELGRDLKNVIIVDNIPRSFYLHSENGIPIESWFEDPEDTELMKMVPILKWLSSRQDVRKFIPALISGERVSYK